GVRSMARRRYVAPPLRAASGTTAGGTMTGDMTHIIHNSNSNLRDLTPARVSLPTTGNSIATNEVLGFQLAHAQARDAVHAELSLPSFAHRLVAELPVLGEASIPILQLRSNAPDRAAY